jgi:hypothetical protein
MARQRTDESTGAQKWGRLVEEWLGSGLTQEAFCRRRGVSVATLRWWKWRLGREERSARVPPGASGGTPPPGSLVPVRIVESRFPVSQAASLKEAGGYEVVLPCGWRLHVPVDFDAQSLARLLAVVEAQSRC